MSKVLQQSDLAVAASGEVAVSAFRWDGPMSSSIPYQHSLAKPGAGRDQPGMTDGVRLASVQDIYLVRCKFGDAVAVGLKVVDQRDVPYGDRLHQLVRVKDPRQVGKLQTPIAHRARNPKARSGNLFLLRSRNAFARAQEFVHHLVEASELVRRKLFIAEGTQPAVGKVVER
jgi:hypothetical protein